MQDRNKDHATVSQLRRLVDGSCSIELNPVAVSLQVRAVTQLSHVEKRGRWG